MIVQCEECGLVYDDVDYRVICPHPKIEGVVRMFKYEDGREVEGEAHSVREIDEFFGRVAPDQGGEV